MGLSQQEALELFRSDDLIGIGMAANQLRKKKNDPRVASYQIDRNINYTNFCTEYCSFCAFYRPLGSKEGYVLSLDTILQKIEETIALGGTGILMQGGLHPDLRIDYYENLLRSTATMMFGCGEEYRHRVNHFERIRRLQEDTGGFTAFIPWMFAPENTSLGKRVPEATAADYLKTLAISRLYLDNIDHIQSSWLTPGIKVCQVGLQFGADDVGSILIEENVVFAAGVRNRTNESELRRIISDAGFIPAQRDTLYRSYLLK